MESIKGSDRELEKLLSEIPTPQSTSSSTHLHNHYHRQLFETMGLAQNNAVSVPDDVSSTLSPSYDVSSNYQGPTSHLVDHQFMMPGSNAAPDHCYLRNNNGCVVIDKLGGLSGDFQNMNLGDRHGVCTNNNSRQFVLEPEGFRMSDPNVSRNTPLNVENYRFYEGVSGGGFRSTRGINNLGFGDKPTRCVMGHRNAAAGDPVESYMSQNQSNDLYSNPSYYSCPISYPFEGNECYRNGAPLRSPSPLYFRSCSAADPLQHCKMGSKGGEDVFSSRHCLQNLSMYKPYSNETLLHQCGTNVGVLNPMNMNMNVNSSDMIHPKHVENAMYTPTYLKGRMRAEDNMLNAPENRGLFPQPLVLMKTAKKVDNYGGLEDTYIIQERFLNASNGKYDPSRVRVRNCHSGSALHYLGDKGLEFNSLLHPERMCENGRSLLNCHPMVLQPTINSLSDVQGNIYSIAKDQHGCRFLQKKFEEGSFGDVEIIFNEIIDRIVELMMNPFGNYLIQKLLDVCHEEQRMRIVHMVTREPGELVRISLNTHGTRVVQKLIETLSTEEQISLVVLALEPGFIDLIKDLNGNHVIQRCLQCLNSEDNKFIFDAAAKFCVDIATHRHGCCVLQRCIDHSNGEQRQKLIAEICANGLLLAQDPFGNYVVQYILEKKMSCASSQLVSQFEGHYVHLSMQKFSSHVVEKCLKYYEESRPRIVHELLSVSHFEQVLQDQYANYVIQSALDVTKGPVHDSLVAAVRPHTILRTNPYCKKIFSRGLLKK